MSEILVGILGLLTIVGIVITLFKTKTVPSVAFIVFPLALAIVLVIGGYYTFDNIGTLIKGGFNSTAPTAALFVFSVLYFGIMTDAGMFDVIINGLMKLVKDNVVGVCVLTSIIALIGHLDGGGASTFCIVVPAMLPVYKKLHMRPTTMLRCSVIAMGVFNLLPWAGPTMRAATVIGMEAGSLWRSIIPIQVVGVVCALAVGVISGILEKKRIASLNGVYDVNPDDNNNSGNAVSEKNELARPKLFWFNIVLTLGVIALLIWGKFPDYVPFMIGFSVALLVNYTPIKMQKKVINKHAGPALMMCSTLLGAAVLMGMFVQTITVGGGVQIPSVITCMADLIVRILPDFLGRHIALVIGILSVPLALCFDTDSYFYGMLPVIIGIGNSFGVDALPIAIAMVVCRNCATFISPMVPATLLGVGLADVDIKDHIKSSFLWVWGVSIVCMIFAMLFGIMPF